MYGTGIAIMQTVFKLKDIYVRRWYFEIGSVGGGKWA